MGNSADPADPGEDQGTMHVIKQALDAPKTQSLNPSYYAPSTSLFDIVLGFLRFLTEIGCRWSTYQALDPIALYPYL